MTSVLVTPAETGDGCRATPSTEVSGGSSSPSHECDKPATAPTALRAGVLAAALAALCLAELLVVMDNTIVNVAIPTFSREMGASTTQLQWIVDAYTLAFACLLLPVGHLGDRLGRRAVLVAGLVGFGVVSAATALSAGLGAVILCRVLLGMSAAFIYPATLSLIVTTFAGSLRKNMAVALWAATSGVGIALGPIIGGILLEHFSWQSIFWINVPLAVAAVGAVLAFVGENRAKDGGGFDTIGVALSAAGVGAIVWAIIEGPQRGWTSLEVGGAFVAGLLALALLVGWELHWRHPLIDVRLFLRREFSAGAIAISAAFFGLFGFTFVITQYFQAVRGYSALLAGVATLPFAVVMAGVSPLSSLLARRFGPGWVVGTGLTIMGLGFARVIILRADSSYWGIIVPAMVVMAAGLALVQAPATSAIMGVVRGAQVGAASAMNDTTREIGGTLGVAVLGSVVADRFGSAMNAATLPEEMPAGALTQARDSVSAAMAISEQLPSPLGEALQEVSSDAFMGALHHAVIVVAVVAWVGAALSFIILPRGRQYQD
ncbi:MFS transporter [Actinomyces timonensis]|uniref:MFS transporter n=1 Tax=Actinomyces timonensis TaxID=1288391 RepID=A0AAU8N1T0_9ACTO